ncbi:MAG: hypothetical protein HZA24_12025 [Nitrospirae bacterium]|nr:hypothetical protein [Nitrospirota bacterium]
MKTFLMSLTKWLLRLFGLVTLAFIVFVVASGFERYHYISIEGAEGVRMVERARPTLLGVQFFVGKVPVRYQAERPGYTLLFTMPEYIEGPALEIMPQPPGTTLRFNPEVGAPAEWCGSGAPSEATLSAPPWWFSAWECTPERARTHRVMRFDVLDANGNVLGHEEIPYQWISRGFSLLSDLG